MEDGDAKSSQKNKNRHKKKKLYASILKQMEFYFSDAALSKDRFLCQLTAMDPFISLDVFLSFNKIKVLTEKTTDIARALRDSTLLELSEDGTKVKRSVPFVPYDVDGRTIYAESIPVSADINWINDVFQAYGPVAYVSLPKYSKTKRIKGFAFIEFQKPADAEKCLQAFTSMGCKLPTTIKPETLQSIKTFNEENTYNEGNSENKNETYNPIDDDSYIEPPNKRMKIHDIDSETSQDKELKIEIVNERIDQNISQDIEVKYAEAVNVLENPVSQDEMAKKSKPVRKRKKKDRKKSRKEMEKKGLEGATKGLQILSKKEWKILRNKYLNMQRNHMKALKQVLRTQHTLPEAKAPGAAFLTDSSQGASDYQDATPKTNSKNEIPFVEGVIVTARLSEPCINVKELKKSTKANIHVKYVDVKEGASDIYIRMDKNAAAKQFISSGIFAEARILEGEEEKLYWDELKRRQTDSSSSKRAMRGRDRLVQKAQQYVSNKITPVTQPGRHIRFDE